MTALWAVIDANLRLALLCGAWLFAAAFATLVCYAALRAARRSARDMTFFDGEW